MKRNLAVILSVWFLLINIAANAIQQDTFSLGYFSYKVPTGWQISEEDSTLRTHVQSLGGDDGLDAIIVKSTDLGQTVMPTEKQLSNYYDKLITQLLENYKLKKPSYKQVVKIAGEDGRIFGFSFSTPTGEKAEHATASLVLGNGQLVIGYLRVKGDRKEVKAALNSLLTEVQYTGPAPFNPKTYGSFQYRSVARNPSTYIGEKVKIRGVVVQVMGNAKEGFEMRVATSGKYDDIIYVTTKGDLPENLLEDDVLDLYCELTGEYNYNTVLGSSLTIPSAILEYYIIRK